MEQDRDTLIFIKSGSSKDLYKDFNIKTTSAPLFVPSNIKNLPSRNWADENGEDTYFPSESYFEAYETSISVIYKGVKGTFSTSFNNLIDYFTKGGTELTIQSPYSNTSCNSAYFKGFSSIKLESSDDNGDVAEFDINFRITVP